MALRYDEVADLIRIIDASACEELVLETAELKLVVRRGRPAAADRAPDRARSDARPEVRPAAPPEPVAAAAPGPAPPAAPWQGEAPQPIAAGHAVRSPMVGTFYRASAPDKPPFVQVGTTVEVGQPLCVIEVMKLFTTIYADRAGRIEEIAVGNAELVEYEQILFRIADA